MPLATPILIAAKTVAPNLFIPFGLATGFAFVIGPVQFTRTMQATVFSDFFRQLGIDFFQQLM